ncbi:unnamed protein product, partial [marine sediment metagenome]
MIQKQVMDFVCAAGLLRNRFVTITRSTHAVAYTAAGGVADGITIGDESNLKIAVQLLGNLNSTFFFDAAGVFAVGDEIEVTTDGKGIKQAAGAVVCYAKDAGVDGSFGVGYNTTSAPMSASGTPGVGVTAVEEGQGSFHKTILTVDGILPAIAGGANLAAGLLVYTLP